MEGIEADKMKHRLLSSLGYILIQEKKHEEFYSIVKGHSPNGLSSEEFYIEANFVFFYAKSLYEMTLYKESKEVALKALAASIRSGETKGRSRWYQLLAKISLNQNMTNEARRYIDQFSSFSDYEEQNILHELYELETIYYVSIGDKDRSLSFFTKYMAAHDAYNTEENNLAYEKALVQYATLEKEKELVESRENQLRQATEIQKGRTHILVLILLALLLLSLVSYFIFKFNNKRKFALELAQEVRKQTEELQKQNDKIAELVFLASHNIRGNLCTIHSLNELMQNDYQKYDQHFFNKNFTEVYVAMDGEIRNLVGVLSEERVRFKLSKVEKRKLLDKTYIIVYVPCFLFFLYNLSNLRIAG